MKVDIHKPAIRWNHIDLMEFIGIFFVVIYHCTTYSYSWLYDHAVLSYLRYFLTTIFSTCVPLFFFVNGYLLLNRPFDLKKHIFKMLNILYLTGIWDIIIILLLMPIKKEYLTLGGFLECLWAMPQGWTNYLWYMGTLIGIYIFFPLLKTAFDTNRKIFIYFTITCAILTFGNVLIGDCASIVLNLLKLHDGAGRPNFFNMFNPFIHLYAYSFVYFCVGGLAHLLKGRIEQINEKKRILAASFILFISCSGLFVTGILLSNIKGVIWDVVWYGFDTVFTLVNVVMVFVLSLSYHSEIRLIKSISVNTLGIYFIHVILIHLTRQYAIQIPLLTTFGGCIIYAFAILVISYLVTLLLSKVPFLKMLVKL